MSAAVLFIFYGSIAFCIVAGAARLVSYATAPLHLRWELHYRSSIYELSEWWTRPHIGFAAKFRAMLIEMLTLGRYYRQNRGFWYVLYPFHLGLYLLVLWHAWIFIVPLVAPADIATLGGLVWGHIATGLLTAGALGILIKRLADARLRLYYPAMHYMKWVFVIITLGGGFYAVYFYFGGMTEVLAYVKGQLAFRWEEKLNPPLIPSLHVLAVAAWFIYLPFSHMVQLFSRYYHELRWDYVPNLRGSGMERRVGRLLERRLTWAAPHIQPARTWAEAARGTSPRADVQE